MHFFFAFAYLFFHSPVFAVEKDPVTGAAPLQLFVAQDDKTVRLQWSGIPAQQSCSFLIERKFQEKFYVIDSCKGDGSSLYTRSEKYPSAGRQVYRIRCMRKGQPSFLSEEKTIDVSRPEKLTLSISPGSASMTVFHSVAGEHEKIILFNNKDKVIVDYDVTPGRSFTSVSLPSAPAGLYHLALVRQRGIVFHPVLIE
ncbi:MAG: hypothetical protein DI535_09170 [Citrobacter freundii]|nr:MAG: hypothetical protein DI535_09170 [Citrobacter freundii]